MVPEMFQLLCRNQPIYFVTYNLHSIKQRRTHLFLMIPLKSCRLSLFNRTLDLSPPARVTREQFAFVIQLFRERLSDKTLRDNAERYYGQWGFMVFD